MSKIKRLCDKLENLLEEEEAHFQEYHGEGFEDRTWLVWAELREILTGHDCIQGKEDAS